VSVFLNVRVADIAAFYETATSKVYPVANAIGGISRKAHDNAIQRILSACAQPVTAISLVAELRRDWGRPGADRLRGILRWYFRKRAEIAAAS
jgi:hypothetical protein